MLKHTQSLLYAYYLILIVFIATAIPAQATHLRAGEITAVRTGTFTYCFTITVYMDVGPDVSADSPDLDINWGDGSPVENVARSIRTSIGNFTTVNIYTRCHTFPGNGAYRIFFVEENRNNGVLNFSNSGLTPFSVETLVIIDPVIGLNNTPVLRVAPIDVACVGQKFTHNPGAFDIDGDSLSFKLTIPKQSSTQNVANYQNPNLIGNGQNEDKNGSATFAIDPITGTLTWNAPAQAGEYNLAFLIEEWRNGIRIGYVVRDMQILVFDCNNKRPNLDPQMLCVVADEDPATTSNIINLPVIATDPNGNNIVISSSQEQAVYDTRPASRVFNNVATFTFNPNPQASPATATFRWDTRCEHVRREPYIVVFKAQDIPVMPNNPLVDIEPWLITVKGPAPTGLAATPIGKSVQLNWTNYKNTCMTASEIVIWRRVGCVSNVGCMDKLEDLGYSEVGRVSAGSTTFTDNGPLLVGLSYSYRIVALFPEPRGGESLPSIEQCVNIPLNAPLITKVSVENTSSTAGSIQVRWVFPPDLDNVVFARPPSPYQYQVFRSEGLTGNTARTLVHTVVNNDPNTPLSFLDMGLNTQEKSYNYQVELRTGPALVLQEPSNPASSVRLGTVAGSRSITLTWDYQVPWSNQNKIHKIFRGAVNAPKSSFVQIGTVNVGMPRFVDDGSYMNICLQPDSTYAYFVKTEGSYFNTKVSSTYPSEEPILNDSQISTAKPVDNSPPQAPVLSLNELNCEFFNENTPLRNIPYWRAETGGNSPCLRDVAFYRLYYRPSEEGEFSLLRTLPDTFFVHNNPNEIRPDLISLAGCYTVTAVDLAGNESPRSNEVCRENCIFYELPNVITPDGDGKNDVLQPLPTPRFVESVKFEVYNRWGNKVFDTRDILLNWDGKNQNGQELAPGIYYYSAQVKFITLSPQLNKQNLKGWIKILK